MPQLTGEFSAGALFGAALAAAGIHSPATIKAQMRLSDFTMLQTFLAASASGALAVHLADRLGHAPLRPRAPRNLGFFAYDGNAIGGALLGAGMAATGACPGTALVQAAAGAGVGGGWRVVLGGVGGAVVHDAVRRRVSIKEEREGEGEGKEEGVTLRAAMGPNALLLAWEVLCVVAVWLLAGVSRDGAGPGPRLVGPVAGGCLIGVAQAGTVLLTRHTIGVSGAYGSLAEAICRGGGGGALPTPSVAFAAGMLAGGAVVSRLVAADSAALAAIGAGGADVSAASALAGGFVMVFGARLAGGCTSGHGISGLVTFSWASFVSVAAMFGSGILTAFVLG